MKLCYWVTPCIFNLFVALFVVKNAQRTFREVVVFLLSCKKRKFGTVLCYVPLDSADLYLLYCFCLCNDASVRVDGGMH
jgi:hypothetical protein